MNRPGPKTPHRSPKSSARAPRSTALGAGANSKVPDAPSVALFVGLLVLIVVEYSGLSSHFPLLKLVRFSTVLSYSLLLLVLMKVSVGDLFSRPQTRIFILFVAFTALSVLWADVQIRAFESIRPLVDNLTLFIVTATLVNTWKRVEAIAWAFSLVSIALVALNLDKLSTASRVGFFDAPYFMGDGNDFAWALVISLPIALFLVVGNRPFITRLIGQLSVAACLIGVIGTGSRGGTIGLVAAMFLYWTVLSRRKALTAMFIALVAIGVFALAPAQYFSRMQTVGDYQQDSSAQARLQAWRAATQMAIEHPLGVGAGNFSSAYGRYYKPSNDQSSISWAPGRWLSAHSIYFRTLAEYGFVGLAMLLTLIWANFRGNLATYRLRTASHGSSSDTITWPALLNMSIVGYAICGIFLGGFSYPHVYMLSALTISASRLATGAPLPPHPQQVPRRRMHRRSNVATS